MALRRVCSKSEVASGSVKRIEDLEIAVFNLDGTFYAIKDVCTHEQAPLSEGELIEDTIVCPWHGACFSVETGEALSLPATEPVETFPVVLQGEDVYLEIEAFGIRPRRSAFGIRQAPKLEYCSIQ